MKFELFRYSRRSFLIFTAVLLSVFVFMRFMDSIMLALADLIILGKIPFLDVTISLQGLLTFIGLTVSLALLMKARSLNEVSKPDDIDLIAL